VRAELILRDAVVRTPRGAYAEQDFVVDPVDAGQPFKDTQRSPGGDLDPGNSLYAVPRRSRGANCNVHNIATLPVADLSPAAVDEESRLIV
jgi:hypothetical protein